VSEVIHAIEQKPYTLLGERIILTLWVGATWSIGYLAAPVLFHALDDRTLAGQLAGQMFHVVYLLGLACGALLLFSKVARQGKAGLRDWQNWVILLMIALIAVGLFVLQPAMTEMKAAAAAHGRTLQDEGFGRLHGLSSVFYLITSLLGLILVVFESSSPASKLKHS